MSKENDTESQRPTVVIDEEDQVHEMATSELLHEHYKFGHISFAKLQEMAKQGVLPK